MPREFDGLWCIISFGNHPRRTGIKTETAVRVWSHSRLWKPPRKNGDLDDGLLGRRVFFRGFGNHPGRTGIKTSAAQQPASRDRFGNHPGRTGIKTYKLAPILPSRWLWKPPGKNGDEDNASGLSCSGIAALETTPEERGLKPFTLLICISSFALETTPEERGLRHKLAPILPSRWLWKPPRKNGD